MSDRGFLVRIDSLDVCEYCNGNEDQVLYAVHGDIWCAGCLDEMQMELAEPIETAKIYCQNRPDYNVPAIWQLPDGSVRDGFLMDDLKYAATWNGQTFELSE